MAQRTFIPSITEAMKKVCALLVRARPVIVSLYPGNAALIAALDAALAACQLLYDEAIVEREFGD